MKLELKHLVYQNYKPLKVLFKDKIIDVITEIDFEHGIISFLNSSNSLLDTNNFKLILRPLSDLTKEIELNGEKFIPFNRIDLSMYELKQLYSNLILPTKLEFWQVEKLFEWHFDIYGLIENGLAIDINTLK